MARNGLPSAALLAGSVAIAANLEIGAHELGHLVADRALGVDASVSLHPFAASRIVLAGSLPESGIAWAAAAGPLAGLLVGALLWAGLWRARRPVLLPLVLVGPLACTLEGTNALVQLFEGAAGTDISVLVEHGIPGVALAIASVLLLAGGLVGIAALMPVTGVGPELGPASRVGVPVIGLAAYFVIGLGWMAAFEPEQAGRNLGLVACAAVAGGLVALIQGPVRRGGRPAVHGVAAPVAPGTVGMAAAFVALLLLAF